MKLPAGIELIDLSIYVRPAKTLIISDIHIGYESEMNRKGILMPRVHFREMLDRLGKIILKASPETVVITGDLKHQFGSISDQEWRDTLRFLDFLQKSCGKIVLLKGNHDTILVPIAKKRKIKLTAHYSLSLGKKKVYICHGDVIPKDAGFRESDIVIIGHEHPAVLISDGIRREKFKCFISGPWKGKSGKKKQLIVMPSLNLATEGTDLGKEKLLSPFLQKDIGSFDVYIPAGDDILHYGKLREIG